MKRFDVFKMFGELTEAISDDKVDTMVNELKSVIEVELAMFAVSLLEKYVGAFEESYASPQYEGFRKAVADLQLRFKVMGQLEQNDLYSKIEVLFKDVFRKAYSAHGPDVAESVAIRYAAQMNKNLMKVLEDPTSAMKDIVYPDSDELDTTLGVTDPGFEKEDGASLHPAQPKFAGEIY